MNIAILGAGNAGSSVAADLTLKGHTVSLIKTTDSMHNENYNYLINNKKIKLIENNNIQEVTIDTVSKDLSLIRKSDVIIVYIQTNYHEALIKRIKPYLRDDHILILNPGYLSTAYVLKHCSNIDLTIVEAQSSFIDCRIKEPGTVKISFRNARNPLGIYPQHKKEQTIKKLDLIGYPFEYLTSVIDAGLHNPNLIVHTVGAIMSVPRIEKTEGEYYMYREVFTPSVWNIVEALDHEKMNVMERLGSKRVPYVQACKYRNTLDDSRDAKEVFEWYAQMPNPIKGPTQVDSRYITEDVPQGLVLLESLGRYYGIKTPVTSSLINIANAALQDDFRQNARTINSLTKKSLDLILEDRKSG